MLLRRGEGYFDPVMDVVRFRQLLSVPIDKSLYEITPMEIKVQVNIREGMANFIIKVNDERELIAANSYKDGNTELVIDQDGQISKVKCKCSEFNRGSRNISEPCSHILALYSTASKFMQLDFETDREYKINDILEILL